MDETEKIRTRSQKLRKNMTKEEATLWYQYLKTYPVQFRRQYPVGNYIVDFYCFRAGLVIELDGSQHYESQGIEYDTRRTEFLTSQGLSVMRFSNADINRNLKYVCEMIDRAVKQRYGGGEIR